jgi:hypothetical protein
MKAAFRAVARAFTSPRGRSADAQGRVCERTAFS